MFEYELPSERIAQRPVYPPESAKLLIFDRASNQISDSTYAKITQYIRPGDIFIFNQSKVIPARLFGELGEGSAELLLLRRERESVWRCLGKPMKKFLPGATIQILDQGVSATPVEARIVERTGEKEVLVQFNVSDEMVFDVGTMPIPPYIRNGKGDDEDVKDYQSIFASDKGSVAAPTASLHFSQQLVSAMQDAGAEIQQVTLHVGAASFLPLWSPDEEVNGVPQLIKNPGIELFKYDGLLIQSLLKAKNEGRRIIAVGTTVVRALESMVRPSGQEEHLSETDLFIRPGFEFQICTNLVTNFHQPRTTHLLLVSAFCSETKLKTIYSHALTENYRFLSYGDGMFII